MKNTLAVLSAFLTFTCFATTTFAQETPETAETIPADVQTTEAPAAQPPVQHQAVKANKKKHKKAARKTARKKASKKNKKKRKV